MVQFRLYKWTNGNTKSKLYVLRFHGLIFGYSSSCKVLLLCTHHEWLFSNGSFPCFLLFFFFSAFSSLRCIYFCHFVVRDYFSILRGCFSVLLFCFLDLFFCILFLSVSLLLPLICRGLHLKWLFSCVSPLFLGCSISVSFSLYTPVSFLLFFSVFKCFFSNYISISFPLLFIFCFYACFCSFPAFIYFFLLFLYFLSSFLFLSRAGEGRADERKTFRGDNSNSWHRHSLAL